MHRLDLATLKESAARDLELGKPTGDPGDSFVSIKATYLISGGRLLLLTGTETMFFDHDHLP